MGLLQAAHCGHSSLKGHPLAPSCLSDSVWLVLFCKSASLLKLFPSCSHLQVVREAAYVKSSKDVGKWQPVVLQNRRAEQLVFPLKEEIVAVAPLEQVVSAWKVGALTCPTLPPLGRSSSSPPCFYLVLSTSAKSPAS